MEFVFFIEFILPPPTSYSGDEAVTEVVAHVLSYSSLFVYISLPPTGYGGDEACWIIDKFSLLRCWECGVCFFIEFILPRPTRYGGDETIAWIISNYFRKCVAFSLFNCHTYFR